MNEIEISALLSQIKARISNLEASISLVEKDVPPNLNSTLLNIRSNISNSSKTLYYYNSSTINQKIDVSKRIVNDNYAQIENFQNYIKNHFNNEIQKHFSELNNKIMYFESNFVEYPNFENSTPSTHFTNDFENKINKSFNDFVTKSQSLYSKISDIQVQKKFDDENSSNNMIKSLDIQIKQQKKDIEQLKTKIGNTQASLNKLEIETQKNIKKEKKIESQNTIPPNLINAVKEQKKKVDVLSAQWINSRESLLNKLSSIDNNIGFMLKSSEEITRSVKNCEQTLYNIENDRIKVKDTFDSIQNRIKIVNDKLDKMTGKTGIGNFKSKSLKTLDKDRIQIEKLEDYVNQLYDKITITLNI